MARAGSRPKSSRVMAHRGRSVAVNTPMISGTLTPSATSLRAHTGAASHPVAVVVALVVPGLGAEAPVALVASGLGAEATALSYRAACR